MKYGDPAKVVSLVGREFNYDIIQPLPHHPVSSSIFLVPLLADMLADLLPKLAIN